MNAQDKTEVEKAICDVEKAICYVCNGTKPSKGEAIPMCIEHYKSEVVDRWIKENEEKSTMFNPQTKIGDLKIEIKFNETDHSFTIMYFQSDVLFFRYTVDSVCFEEMTAQMVKMVKDSNLTQAKDYTERMKNGQ